MSRRGLGIQAALLATLALVACGGEEASDASDGISVSQIDEDQRRDFQEARLEFARCMREKGFDVPDPQSGPPSGGAGQGGALGDLDLNDPRVQEAMEACSAQGPGLRLAE
jgi:hypothetical protein